MTIKEMTEIMLAFEDGKQIEYKCKGEDTWWNNECPQWDWNNCEYRIKSEQSCEPEQSCKTEQSYKPYDSVDEIDKNKWVKDKKDNILSRIEGIDPNHDLCVHLDFGWITLKELFTDYTYEDGSRCGKRFEV